MRLAVKIALSIVVIVALAVSISGYVIMASGFQSQIDYQVESMANETQLLCTTLGVMAAQRRTQSPDTSVKAVLEETLRSTYFQKYDLTLNQDDPFGKTDMRDTIVIYSIKTVAREDGEHYEIVMERCFNVDDCQFYLESRRDITDIFQIRDNNIMLYRYVFLSAAGLSLMIGFTVGTVLTSPVRKLSRSAKRIAAGQYSVRARVGTSDEIGVLADQFNKMADNLQGHMGRLEQAAQQQKDFTASFAHELKTPLTSIIGYADTLRSRQLPPNQQFEAASFIFSEGKRLEDMSHALLRLFSLDGDAPQMVYFSAMSLARSVEESSKYPLYEKHLVLEFAVQDARLRGEPQLLGLLLYNLIDNARKASEPGSKITLWGGMTDEGYCFFVKDRGRGIPEEALARICEPFYMVDKSRARAEGGAGLGLALCQRIAELHGTQLQYKSQVGRGTTVAFYVPEGSK